MATFAQAAATDALLFRQLSGYDRDEGAHITVLLQLAAVPVPVLLLRPS